MINPSSLDLAALPSLCLSRRLELPETPAIYFAIDSLDQIQYIGRSQNLRQRWASHHRHFQLQAIDSVRIAWLQCDDVSLLAEIETVLIEWFEPPLNRSRIVRPVTVPGTPGVYIDIGSYWPKNLSVNAAYEELLMQGRKVDRRTLVAAKTGILTKSEYLTLVRLRDWVREISGDPSLTIDDLLKIEDEHREATK